MQDVTVDNIVIGKGRPLALIAGPCVLEEESIAFEAARFLASLRDDLGIPVIFKTSYEKDNRTLAESYRGPGLTESLKVLGKIKQEFGMPVTSDIHRISDISEAAEILDVIQIPAYLCKQTSLLIEAASVGKPINVKKGQFLSPEEMSGITGKILNTGNNQILLTERGTCFGYNHLISDMCAIPIMQSLGFPVVFDATHIVLRMGSISGHLSGGHGRSEFVPYLVRAGVAAGCNALFIECHPSPPDAKCDSESMVALSRMKELMEQALEVAEVVRNRNIA